MSGCRFTSSSRRLRGGLVQFISFSKEPRVQATARVGPETARGPTCCSFCPAGSERLLAEFQPRSPRNVGACVCSVPCKVFQDELGDLCRREKLYCKDLGVNKSNINDYEVEFLCDYKKTKVSHRPSNTQLLPKSQLWQTRTFLYLPP